MHREIFTQEYKLFQSEANLNCSYFCKFDLFTFVLNYACMLLNFQTKMHYALLYYDFLLENRLFATEFLQNTFVTVLYLTPNLIGSFETVNIFLTLPRGL